MSSTVETGYITRWCSYSDSEFKEGVSLTCDDEVNRHVILNYLDRGLTL